MNVEQLSHKSGEMVIPAQILDSVEQVILNVKLPFRKNGVSAIKDEILKGLYAAGWSEEVQIDNTSKVTITSMFEKFGLCLQTGNVGRMYADLIKLQTLFVNDVISAGIMAVPDKKAARSLGSNIVNSDRLMRELSIYKSVISLPLVIISFGK
jgi:hypothetical protein